MFASSFDAAVLGAGPAGLALATACADVGMRVVCVSPEPAAPWERTFAVWSCELDAFGVAAPVEARWDRPRIWIDEAQAVELPHGYVRLEAAALQRRMVAGAAKAGVTFMDARVAGLEHDARGSTIVLEGGGLVRAGVVGDATGPGSRFVTRSLRRQPAQQVAYGELIEPGDPVEMSLMDFRGPPGEPPTFLYALPLPDGSVFLEETVLATRQPISMQLLERRLHARLERTGIARRRVLARERCVIPLGIGLPSSGQRVFAFGAAGGMVHPATGYQLARVVASAPAIARALANAPTPAEATRRAYRACWSASSRRAWALYTFGMEAICAFDLDGLRAFMRAFFSLPPAASLGFLRGELTPSAVAAAMTRVLLDAEPAVRRRIARLVFDQHETLTRALIPEEIA